jgi:hypothetical protein
VTSQWNDKIREMSLDHLYMTDLPLDRIAGVPPHPVWQAPFLFADADEPLEDLGARVARAGSLWLVNYDFRPFNELVIAHVERPWVMIFQRAERPDEGHIEAGPFAVRALEDEGAPLPRVPFVFVEHAQASRRDEMRKLARRRGGSQRG